jgi:hypothetical protein
MKRRALLAFCLGLGAMAAQAADFPKWLVEARARESKPIAPREVRSKDNWLIAKVPARAVGAIEKVDSSYSIEFDHGDGASIYCEVVPDGIDLADMVRVSAHSTLKRLADLQGEIEMQQIDKLDAGVFGDVPYLSISWLYTVKSAKGPLIGAFKQISMKKDETGIYCAHVDVGYTKTFENIVRALAATLQTADVHRTPYYHEVATVSVGATKSGVVIITLERDAEGDSVATQKTSILLPAPAGNVTSQDSVNIEWIDSDAALINAVHIIARDGELTSNLKLNAKDGQWVVDGEMQGKAVSTRLEQDAHPGTWVAQAWQLRKLLAAPGAVGAVHTIPMWASSNPAKLTDGTTKILAKIDDRRYHALSKIGTLNADVTLDAETGLPSDAEIKMGPQKMKLERVFVSGAF